MFRKLRSIYECEICGALNDDHSTRAITIEDGEERLKLNLCANCSDKIIDCISIIVEQTKKLKRERINTIIRRGNYKGRW